MFVGAGLGSGTCVRESMGNNRTVTEITTMKSETEKRELATPHPSEVNRVSSVDVKASQSERKSLQRRDGPRLPLVQPLLSSQRKTIFQEKSNIQPAAFASSSHAPEMNRVSSVDVQASQRKGKSLERLDRPRSPLVQPLLSSQRKRLFPEGSKRPAVVASSSHPKDPGEDNRPTQETVTDEETSKLVAEVMRHMLFKSHKQPNVPVRRGSLVQLIRKTYKERALPRRVILLAQRRMEKRFGIQMKEIAVRRRSGKDWKDSREYVLESILPKALLQEHVLTPTMASNLGFVLLVVGIIKFSTGMKVNEEILLERLCGIGVEAGHPVFRDVKDALATAAKQRYIQKVKLTGIDGKGFGYELAERSLEPSFNKHLKEFLSQVTFLLQWALILSNRYSTPSSHSLQLSCFLQVTR